MRTFALAATLALALPAAAIEEEMLSPSQFRDYAEGWTLYFTDPSGEPVGAESFGSDGQATWQTPDGTCVDGLWKPHGGQLCFYYGFESEVQCWRVLRDDEGMFVRQVGEDPEVYRIVRRDRKPLLCGGPATNI